MAYRPTENIRQRAEQKREALLRAATRLVAAHGFASATVSAVTRECNVSAGSLYSYFDSRDEFLAEVFRATATHEMIAVRQAVEATEAEPEQQLSALIEAFAGRALRGRQLAWSLLFEPVSVTIEHQRLKYRRAYAQLGEAIICDGITAGRFIDQDITLAASALIGAISEALVGRLSPVEAFLPDSISDEQIVRGIQEFCLRALGAQTPTVSKEGQL